MARLYIRYLERATGLRAASHAWRSQKAHTVAVEYVPATPPLSLSASGS